MEITIELINRNGHFLKKKPHKNLSMDQVSHFYEGLGYKLKKIRRKQNGRHNLVYWHLIYEKEENLVNV